MNVPMKKDNQKGFTIIEVVLVLAIAGLIFLMVFIALPALQRSQRDTQRRNDLSRVQSAIQSYQTSNRGSLPSFDNTFIAQYLTVGGDKFADPNGDSYQFKDGTADPAKSFKETLDANANIPTIYVATGSTCGDNGAVIAGGATKVAVEYKLEGGGIACVNN